MDNERHALETTCIHSDRCNHPSKPADGCSRQGALDLGCACGHFCFSTACNDGCEGARDDPS